MNKMQSIPVTTLFYQGSKGAIRVWSIFPNEKGYITESGQHDGVMQQTQHNVEAGLAGRTREQQIQLYIKSHIKKKIDAGFVHDIEHAKNNRPTNALGYKNPMLAKKYKDYHPDDIDWSRTFVQRKYNGHRCLINTETMQAYSRRGNLIKTIHEIMEEVAECGARGHTLDGELYLHGVRLQTIGSYVKKRQEMTAQLVYIVYDVIMDEPFIERLRFLQSLKYGTRIAPAQTSMCMGQYDPIPLMDSFINEGYEGAIIRINDFPYEDGKRSHSVIKVKKKHEREFVVLDILRSVDGWARLVCQVKKGSDKTFNCSAPGTIEEKTEILENKEQYIGRKVTVEFEDWSKDGIPTQPVAKQFREDL
jgi:ATP-dependent DNA ligase